jgi:hypothetical protein
MGKEIYKETIKEFHHYNTKVIVDNTQVNELKNKINQMQNNQEMASLYFKQYVQNVQNNQEIMRNYYENCYSTKGSKFSRIRKNAQANRSWQKQITKY